MGVCYCSIFRCTLLYVHSSIAIFWMGKRELVALLNLSSWWLVMVERLFLAVPSGCLRFVIVVFPDHTRLLFLNADFSLRWMTKNISFFISVKPTRQCNTFGFLMNLGPKGLLGTLKSLSFASSSASSKSAFQSLYLYKISSIKYAV